MEKIKYWSDSLGMLVDIDKMNDYHLENAAIKVARQADAGDPALKNALLEECNKRGILLPTDVQPTVDEKLAHLVITTPSENAEVKPVEAPAKRSIYTSKKFTPEQQQQLRTLFTDARKVLTTAEDEEFLRELEDIFEVQADTEVKEEAKPDVSPDTSIKDVLLKYGKIDMALVNSLKTYGVTTLRDLTNMTIPEFAAVRFSTVPAFYTLHEELKRANLSWSNNKVRVISDAVVPSILVSRAQPIRVFMDSTHNSIASALKAGSKSLMIFVFETVKRRVALCNNALVDVFISSALSLQDGLQQISRINYSTAFKQQLKVNFIRKYNRIEASKNLLLLQPVS